MSRPIPSLVRKSTANIDGTKLFVMAQGTSRHHLFPHGSMTSPYRTLNSPRLLPPFHLFGSSLHVLMRVLMCFSIFFNTDEYLDWMEDGRDLWDGVRDLQPTILTGLPMGDWAEPQKVGQHHVSTLPRHPYRPVRVFICAVCSPASCRGIHLGSHGTSSVRCVTHDSLEITIVKDWRSGLAHIDEHRPTLLGARLALCSVSRNYLTRCTAQLV